METNLQIFENPEFGEIRSVMIDGEPWLVGKDVAMALGYSDTDQAIRRNVDEDDKLTRTFYGSGQNRNMTVINESGLYSLVMSSKLPTAKRFKRWVTSEVLPALRKTGTYTMPKAEEPEDEFDTVCRALQIVDKRAKQLEARNMVLENRNEALERKIARDAGKVAYAEAVQETWELISVGDLAKILYQTGNTDMGRMRLFARLREDGYVMYSGEVNVPQQKAIEAGLLRLVEYTYARNSQIFTSKKTMVTPKGKLYFCKRYGRN